MNFYISLKAFDKIVSATGIDVDYILYGESENIKREINVKLQDIIEKSDNKELRMYYKCICTIKSYINKKTND